MNIGKNLKNIRQIQGKTQPEISKATGITQGALSYWERNQRTPNIIDCIKLADYYQISLDELVGRDFF